MNALFHGRFRDIFTRELTLMHAARVAPGKVLDALGYRIHQAPSRIIKLVDKEVAAAAEFINPSYVVAVKTVEHYSAGVIWLEGGLRLASPTISYVLSDCKFALLLLTTIGRKIEDEAVRRIRENEILRGYILDTIGSQAIESLADSIQDEIERIVHQHGCEATLRYSPGYCDWDIMDQKQLFRVLDAGSIGVTLTDSCLMVPRKSISGITGIFDRTMGKRAPCVWCKQKVSCSHKRTRL